MYLNATTPRHPNSTLTLEIPYVLTVDAAALLGASTIRLKSNIEIFLPKNTVVLFGAFFIQLNQIAKLSRTAIAVNVLPLAIDIPSGVRSDAPLPAQITVPPTPQDRPRHVLSTQIKAWLADSGRRGSFNLEPLETGQTVLKGRALEPIPEQFKPCQYGLVQWDNGDRGILKFFASPASFLNVEKHLGQRIQGIYSAEVP